MIERYSRSEMKAIWSDESRYKHWLEIEILACEARAFLGLMPAEAANRIRTNAKVDPIEIVRIEEQVRHDVIAFVTNVGESLGSDACYFHEGLTSSDILDTAFGLQLVDAARLIRSGLVDLRHVIGGIARKHKMTPTAGRTHGVHAEPISFGMKFAVFYQDVGRSIRRLDCATDEIRVGKLSGAVGTFTHLPPEVEIKVCEHLGLEPETAATQIIQRDRHAAFMLCISLIASIIEKIAIEIRHLQRTEVLEVEEPFGKGQRGSSAMPHKKNPILCENICGLARLIRSFVAAALENVPLWHERDISHSSAERVMFPDATIALDFIIHRLKNVLSGLVIHEERMMENLDALKGLVFSQKVLLMLTGKGISRDEAYRIVQRCAMMTWKDNTPFKRNLENDPQISVKFSSQEIAGWFELDPYLKNIEYIFDRAGLADASPSR